MGILEPRYLAPVRGRNLGNTTPDKGLAYVVRVSRPHQKRECVLVSRARLSHNWKNVMFYRHGCDDIPARLPAHDV